VSFLLLIAWDQKGSCVRTFTAIASNLSSLLPRARGAAQLFSNTILYSLTQLLEEIRKMVPKKRTYSTVDKRRGMREQDERRKRSKSDEDDELNWPGGHASSRPLKSSLLLKKGLKKFGGPVSFPEDDEDSGIASKTTSRLSVLDRALGGKLNLVKPKQNSIYGSREDFEKTIQAQSAKKSNEERTTSSYLPTPPIEVQEPQKQLANRFILSTKEHVANMLTQVTTPAWRPSSKSEMSEKNLTHDEPKQPYIPKQFEADRSLAPHRDLTGSRLSSKSKEAKL
jgi:hypothetical protein